MPESLDDYGPVEGPPGIDVLLIPAGTLCYVNALAGEVWIADRTPQRQWLRDLEEDAKCATD